MSLISSTIIEDIKTLCEASQASMGYFYFDFRNANKQGLRDLILSLLAQLSARSTARCDILSKLYSDHDDGKMQPSDSVLTKCLKDMLTLPGQHPIYLIMDALDESSATSGIPSPRERVLQLVTELVDLCHEKLHICVTSRPEIDIKDVLEPLTSCRVSLHDQTGQKKDIADYIRSVVYSKLEPIIRRWKNEHKDLVIGTLSERAAGMYVNNFTLFIFVQIVKQVPLGVLSIGNFTALSSIERPAVSRRTTGIFGRDIRARAEGDQEAKSRSRSTSIAMPRCGDSSTSCGGAYRSPRSRLRRCRGDPEVETRLAVGGSRTSTFYVMFQFNRHRRHR